MTLSIFTNRVLDKKQEVALTAEDTATFTAELNTFLAFIGALRESASKGTHYHKLDEWSKPVYQQIHQFLHKHGFINGGAARNLSQPPLADMWWSVYSMMSSIIHSPYLKTEVADHHASAYERNEALIEEITALIKSLN